MYFLNNNICKSKVLLNLWAAEWILCYEAGEKTFISLYTFDKALGWSGALSMNSNIWKEFFFFFFFC